MADETLTITVMCPGYVKSSQTFEPFRIKIKKALSWASLMSAFGSRQTRPQPQQLAHFGQAALGHNFAGRGRSGIGGVGGESCL